MRKQNRSRNVLLVLLLLTVVLIWGQSVLPVPISNSESKAVTEQIVKPVEAAVTGKASATNNAVRKYAHAIEFLVLGVEMMLLCGVKRKPPYAAFSYCGAIALLDETIQIFSGRGPAIADVWIDLLGAAGGIAAVCLIRLLTGGRKKKTDEN